MLPVRVSTLTTDLTLADLPTPLPLDRLVEPSVAAAGAGGDTPATAAPPAWEVELGFGKGRYLLERARDEPERRFLGVEVAGKYQRLVAKRARRRGLGNLVTVHGEALYLLSTVLPQRFAAAVHVYFPDPWPKARHHKRRLFDEETVDLVLALLAPGAPLFFATDFLDYGERVAEILAGVPGLDLERRDEPWPEGPRTHYEAKYVREGRPILRLRATAGAEGGGAFHPQGTAGVVGAWAERREE